MASSRLGENRAVFSSTPAKHRKDRRQVTLASAFTDTKKLIRPSRIARWFYGEDVLFARMVDAGWPKTVAIRDTFDSITQAYTDTGMLNRLPPVRNSLLKSIIG